MKRIAMVCLLVMVVAGAASAAPYIWKTNATDTVGANAGVNVSVGVKTVSTTPIDQTFDTSNAAYMASVVYTGALDASLVKTNLYNTQYTTAAATTWILQAWAGSQYESASMDIRIWAATAATTKPTGTWTLYKLFDPISGVWGRESLGVVPIAASAGTQIAPWFKVNLPVSGNAKTPTPMDYGKGYILELSSVVPEPGSMVAMLSGLVGLVGFGIRRRR